MNFKKIIFIKYATFFLMGIFMLTPVHSNEISKDKVQKWMELNFPNTFQLIFFESPPLFLGNYYRFTVKDVDNININGTIGYIKANLIALDFSDSYHYTQDENTNKFKNYYHQAKKIKSIERKINKDLTDEIFIEGTMFTPKNITSFSSTNGVHALVYSTLSLDEGAPLLKKALSRAIIENDWNNIKFIYFEFSKRRGFEKRHPLRNAPINIQTFEISRTTISEAINKFEWQEVNESQSISRTLNYLWQPKQNNPMDISLYKHEFFE